MTTPPTGPSPGRLRSLIARVTRALPSRDGVPMSLSELKGSETAKAVGLAGSMIANNVIALVATIVFARLLKNNQGGGYGSLAALVSYFLILSVVGQALQVATAREGVLGQLGSGHGLIATVRRWTTSLLAFTVVLAVISVLLRQQIADLVGVKHIPRVTFLQMLVRAEDDRADAVLAEVEREREHRAGLRQRGQHGAEGRLGGADRIGKAGGERLIHGCAPW